MKRWIVAVIMMISGFMVPWTASAAVPQAVPYQGQLTSAAGVPVNGVVNITFNLYTAATGGVALWSETHHGVNVSKGLFNVTLGSVTAFPVGVFSTMTYLGVTLGGDPEMSPRTKLDSAPYAMHADDADTVGGTPVSQLGQSAHVAATNNPHNVTAAQVGADASGAAAAVQTNLTAHTGNTANPHNVTPVQIGAATSGANSDITSLGGLTTPLSISQGGTGATSAGGGRTNMGAAASGTNADITALTGLTGSVTTTGTVTAGALTDGTATLTAGNLSGVGVVTATSLTDGTAALTGGTLSGLTDLTLPVSGTAPLTCDTTTWGRLRVHINSGAADSVCVCVDTTGAGAFAWFDLVGGGGGC